VDLYGVKLAKDLSLPSDVFAYLRQDRNNFAPRFGFAYKFTPTTVLRGGSGVFNNVLTVNHTERLAIYLPFGLVETFEQPAGSVPSITMSNPFPGQGTIPANPSTSMLNNPITPYVVQWNLTLEKEALPAF
jgi:hypothetical protein